MLTKMIKMIVWLFVTVALLWAGAQGIYTLISSPKPVELTCEHFFQSRPTNKWLNLRQCKINMLESVYVGLWQNITELYIPIRSVNSADKTKTSMVIKTRNQHWIKLIQQWQKMVKEKNQDKLNNWINEHQNQLALTKNISGLVLYGIDLDDNDKKKVAGLCQNLTDNFIILEEGRKPSNTLIFFFIAGLASAVYLIKFLMGSYGQNN